VRDNILFDLSQGRYLTTYQAARCLCLSMRTLERMRAANRGPHCLLLGGRWLYHVDEVHAWAARATRRVDGGYR
jgi:excisionase family DNA binding protein